MKLSAWWNLILALPVLWLGQSVVLRVPILRRYNIPYPVVGGLIVAVGCLAASSAGLGLVLQTTVSEKWWTWLVSTEPEWFPGPQKSVHLPLLVAFFTCIGLNASWSLIRRAGVQAAVFLGVTVLLSMTQNLIGVGVARLIGAPDLLGLVCGSVTLIGGHGTAMGFAGEFEKAGLQGAAVLGVAAATFGMVAGCMVGGPVGSGLIRRGNLKPHQDRGIHLESGTTGQATVISDVKAVLGFGRPGLAHLLLILACVKVGAWVSYFIQKTGVTFPVYMGALLTGVVVRNLADTAYPKIRTEIIDTIGSVMLALFLAMVISAALLLLAVWTRIRARPNHRSTIFDRR